jgi:hypothetical protein
MPNQPRPDLKYARKKTLTNILKTLWILCSRNNQLVTTKVILEKYSISTNSWPQESVLPLIMDVVRDIVQDYEYQTKMNKKNKNQGTFHR